MFSTRRSPTTYSSVEERKDPTTMEDYKQKFKQKKRDDKSWMRKDTTWNVVNGNEKSEMDVSPATDKRDASLLSVASLANENEGKETTTANWINALIAPYSPIKKSNNSPPIKSWQQLKNNDMTGNQRGIDDIYDTRLEESDNMVFHNVVQSIGSGRATTPNPIPRYIINLQDIVEPTTTPSLDETTITSSVVKKIFPAPRIKKRSTTPPPSNHFLSHSDVVEQPGVLTIGITDTIPASSSIHRTDVIPIASPHRHRLSAFKKSLFGQRQGEHTNHHHHNHNDAHTSADENKSDTIWRTSIEMAGSPPNYLPSPPRSIAKIVSAVSRDYMTVEAANVQDIEWYGWSSVVIVFLPPASRYVSHYSSLM